MHRWVLVLMLVLLPLRGWAGDAMAGRMLAQEAAGSHEMAECMGHGEPAHSGAAAHPSPCIDCPLAAVALLPALPGKAPTSFAPPRPGAGPAGFSSADLPPRFKPPIS